MSPIHNFRALTHPLAQIQAAEEFYGQVAAFVSDEWSDLFTDEPPDDEVLDQVSPDALLDTLSATGLRFEVAAAMVDLNDRDDEGFWAHRFSGSSFDALLYSWAYDVMNHVELDSRAFFHALSWTDLVFVPDHEGTAAKAHLLVLGARPDLVHEVDTRHEDLWKKFSRGDGAFRTVKAQRGDGPRTKKPASIDRAAIVLRDARVAMTPEEIAQRMKHKNLASLTAALHQAVNYGKPKRLAGWLQREGTGRYSWSNDDDGDELPRTVGDS